MAGGPGVTPRPGARRAGSPSAGGSSGGNRPGGGGELLARGCE